MSKAVVTRGGKNSDSATVSREFEELQTFIGRRRVDIHQALNSGSNLDGAVFEISRSMLQAIVEALPSLELALKNTTKGVYPFTTLVTSARELMHDLRMMQDREAVKRIVIDKVLDPNLIQLAQDMTTALNRLGKTCKGNPEAKEQIDAIKSNIGVVVNRTHRDSVTLLNKYLSGAITVDDIIKMGETQDDADGDELFARKPTRR